MLLYDAAQHGMGTALGTPWRFAADTVMGGVSRGELKVSQVSGRPALLLTGEVSLDNGGGFIQMVAELSKGGCFDASRFAGLRLELLGDGQPFVLLLKTDELARPWQSYRALLHPVCEWSDVLVPLNSLERHRTEIDFDPRRVRRLGLAALGRPGAAQLALSRAAFVSDPG